MLQVPWLLLSCMMANTGCSNVGVRTAEQLNYEVLESHDLFEIRAYEPYLAAETVAVQVNRESRSSLFRVLAGYIFGGNESNKGIAMTSPVITEKTPEKNWKMSFSMPAKYTMAALPKPLDPRVKLVKVEARTIAAVRYSGSNRDLKKRTDMETALLNWIGEHAKYRVRGNPIYAGYDPPSTLPQFRRNEVLIEVHSLQ